MDQNFQELIIRMESNSRKQLTYARLQCVFSVVAAICCIALLVVGVMVLPKVQNVAQQAEVVLSNLESVTSELAEVDFTGMIGHIDDLVTNVDGLVSSSQQGVENALLKINQIDFDRLNKAIKDLSDVIEPIADFFNGFGR